MSSLLSIWCDVAPHEVNFADEDGASHNHGHGDDGKIDACEFSLAHVDVLPREDITPEEPGERGTEGDAESAIVNAQRHAIHRRPELAVGDGLARLLVYGHPVLYDTTKQDGGTNIGSGELTARLANNSEGSRKATPRCERLTLHMMTDTKAMPPMAPIVPVLSTQWVQP